MNLLVEEYVSSFKEGPNNGRSPSKLETNFRLDPIPWKWTVYDGSKIKSYGYAHTEEDANRIGSEALRKYNR